MLVYLQCFDIFQQGSVLDVQNLLWALSMGRQNALKPVLNMLYTTENYPNLIQISSILHPYNLNVGKSIKDKPSEKLVKRSAVGKASSPDSDILLQAQVLHLVFNSALLPVT